MNSQQRNEIYQKAFDNWGTPAQTLMIIEESSELIYEIMKPNKNIMQLADEIADVEIMLEQATLIFDLNFVHLLISDIDLEKNVVLLLSKLIKQICKWKRFKEDRVEMTEIVSKLMLLLKVLRTVYGISEYFDECKEKKLIRLKNRLEEV